jgi:hypothetical protein
VKLPSFIKDVLVIGISFLRRGFEEFECEIKLVETAGLVIGFARETSLLKFIELHRFKYD